MRSSSAAPRVENPGKLGGDSTFEVTGANVELTKNLTIQGDIL